MKHKTAFRLALRGIGLCIFGMYLPDFIAYVVGYSFRVYRLGIQQDDAYSVVWYMTQTSVGVAFGAYFMFGFGRWFVNWAIPSNRPYCQECSYELTGLHQEGVCPECGTQYRLLPTKRSDRETAPAVICTVDQRSLS